MIFLHSVRGSGVSDNKYYNTTLPLHVHVWPDENLLGWNMGSNKSYTATACRAPFIKTVLSFLNSYKYATASLTRTNKKLSMFVHS